MHELDKIAAEFNDVATALLNKYTPIRFVVDGSEYTHLRDATGRAAGIVNQSAIGAKIAVYDKMTGLTCYVYRAEPYGIAITDWYDKDESVTSDVLLCTGDATLLNNVLDMLNQIVPTHKLLETVVFYLRINAKGELCLYAKCDTPAQANISYGLALSAKYACENF